METKAHYYGPPKHAHARYCLVPKKGQECGLCSASMEKKGCSTTKSGIKVSFDVAIKADNYSMLRKWCLLGKANMNL